MEKLKRNDLKKIAIENGIKNGFNNRCISKMRKSDFLQFISQIKTPVNSQQRQLMLVPRRRGEDARRILFPSPTRGPLALLTFLFSNEPEPEPEPEPDQRSPVVGKINEEDVDDSKEASIDVRCSVCLHNKISILFKNCKHLVTCERCSSRVNKCPVCGDQIKKEDREKIFF